MVSIRNCQAYGTRGAGERSGFSFLEPGIDVRLLESDTQATSPDSWQVSFLLETVNSAGTYSQVGGDLLDREEPLIDHPVNPLVRSAPRS